MFLFYIQYHVKEKDAVRIFHLPFFENVIGLKIQSLHSFEKNGIKKIYEKTYDLYKKVNKLEI